jgi:16S rRNA processing protein RimM
MRLRVLAFFIHMDSDKYFKIGYILKPHGLKGEVTVSVDAEFPRDVDARQPLFILTGKDFVPYFIEKLSVSGEKAFIKFDDIDSVDSASKITKKALYFPKALRAKSAKGEFYDDEVVDFEVTDSDLGYLGKVGEVVFAGSNKLLAVLHDTREILIPVNSPFITSVNKSKKQIRVTLPEGYLEI